MQWALKGDNMREAILNVQSCASDEGAIQPWQMGTDANHCFAVHVLTQFSLETRQSTRTCSRGAREPYRSTSQSSVRVADIWRMHVCVVGLAKGVGGCGSSRDRDSCRMPKTSNVSDVLHVWGMLERTGMGCDNLLMNGRQVSCTTTHEYWIAAAIRDGLRLWRMIRVAYLFLSNLKDQSLDQLISKMSTDPNRESRTYRAKYVVG